MKLLGPVIGVAVGACLVLLMMSALHSGNHRRAATKACHALGPQYHYWLDREQCVRYVTKNP